MRLRKILPFTTGTSIFQSSPPLKPGILQLISALLTMRLLLSYVNPKISRAITIDKNLRSI